MHIQIVWQSFIDTHISGYKNYGHIDTHGHTNTPWHKCKKNEVQIDAFPSSWLGRKGSNYVKKRK